VTQVSSPQRSWNTARVKKITSAGRTERFCVLDLEGMQLTVPESSSRRCFPEKNEVFAFRAYTLGRHIQVEVQSTSCDSSGSVAQSSYLVSRALTPLPGHATTDFGFVLDPCMFSVAGETESVSARLFNNVDDELLRFP